jgi:hypothetical protein
MEAQSGRPRKRDFSNEPIHAPARARSETALFALYSEGWLGSVFALSLSGTDARV